MKRTTDPHLFSEAATVVRSILELGNLLSVPRSKARKTATDVTKEFLGLDLAELFDHDFCQGGFSLEDSIRSAFENPDEKLTKSEFVDRCQDVGIARSSAYRHLTQGIDEGILKQNADRTLSLRKKGGS